MRNNVLRLVLPSALTQDSKQVAVVSEQKNAPAKFDVQTEPKGFSIPKPRLSLNLLTAKNIFFMSVMIPTLITALYMFVFAVDQYKSEAGILVKSAQGGNTTGGIAAILETTGLSVSSADTNAVAEFLQSRGALEELQKRIDFQSMMEVDYADFVARFPGIHLTDSFEKLYDHYLRKVEVITDEGTNIISISALAFTGENAEQIVSTLLIIADDFVDQLNKKSLQDAIAVSQIGVNRAEEKAREVLLKLTRERRLQNIISPEVDLERNSQYILEIEGALVEVEGRIKSLEKSASNSPVLEAARQRQQYLKGVLENSKKQQTGEQAEGNLTLAFEKIFVLEQEAEFAAEALGLARASLERARTDVLAKQIYLAHVVRPHVSDDSRFPKRWANIATVFAVFGGLFVIFWLFLTNMREHAD